MKDGAFAMYLSQSQGITPAKVAEQLGVSVRTVRTYVKQTNEAMRGFARIDLIRGEGYHLVVEDADAFEQWSRAAATIEDDELPQTPEERVTYLLNDLLMRNDWITLDELARMLFVSRSAISGDLKEVERALARFGLTLEKRPHYGIRVEGPEMARRVCTASVVMADYEEKRSGRGGVLPTLDIAYKVSECIEHAIKENAYSINSVAFQNLVVHITIAILRYQEGSFVPLTADALDRLRDSREFAVAGDITRDLANRTGVELPEEEVAYIAIHLAGKQTLALEDDDTGLVISDEVWDVVSQMLELVWSVYRFDFRGDLELRMNLARHIVPLTVRLRYQMNLKNPLLTDIKNRYPLAYAMASDASSVLAERYDALLSDDETGYIALTFALALERQKEEAPKHNVLMVCASGAGSARLMEWRCKQEFGDYLGKIVTCDVLDIDKVDFTDIDYVFTTVPIPQPVPVPVREVRHFLDASEVEDVRAFLRGAINDADGILGYFDPKLFFPHLTCKTKEEVLDYLLARVEEQRTVSPRFRELVWKREGTVATSFGNNVAMPHPLHPASDETFVCVGVLDEPVMWDDYGRTVQVVFLSAFNDKDGLKLQRFYATLANVLVSRRAMRAIVDDPRWDTLRAILATFSSNTARELDEK